MPTTVLGGRRNRRGVSLRAALTGARCCAALLPSLVLLPGVAHAQSPTSSSFAVGWGGNAFGSLGAGFAGPVWGPVAARVSGVRELVASFDSYAVLENGTVDAWGENGFGELGNGTHVSSSTPVPVPGLTDVVAIAAGDEHAMALLANGTVMTWGGNTFGTAGNGTSGHGHELGEPTPQLVPGLKNVVAIAAGGADDVALLSNGTLEAWGENKSGQLGDGTTQEKDVPTPVKGISTAKAVAIGGAASEDGHMLVLLQNGKVMGIGSNFAGQLGDGGSERISTTPVTVKGLTGVSAIAAGVSHSMALLENGTLETWGNDAYGELGVASTELCTGSPCSRVPVTVPLSDVTAISAGFRFSVAISSGKLYAWGWNTHRQLGRRVGAEAASPMLVPTNGDASSISAGAYHTLALVDEPGPAPTVEVSAGRASLTIRWQAGEAASEPWIVKWRPLGASESAGTVRLPPGADSYTIAPLPTQPYEIRIKNEGHVFAFGRKTAVGTPLA